MDSNIWVSLDEPKDDVPYDIPPAMVQRPDTSVLLIADNTRETFLTVPPHEDSGPATIFSENCDVLIVEALQPDDFPLVVRNLLDFTDFGKRCYFQDIYPDPVLKVDDLLFASLKDDENLSGDMDPDRFISHLRGMPVGGDDPQEDGQNRRILEQFRFVECFLTSKERGLANLPRTLQLAVALPEIKPVSVFLGRPDLTLYREKRLWRECSRVAAEWGHSAGSDKMVQYSLVPSFFLRAAMTFDVRSIGLMDSAMMMTCVIEQTIQRVVITVLKRIYGNGYWTRLEPHELRDEVQKRRSGKPDLEPPMNYLYLTDYRVIVEHQNQWEHFCPYFTLGSWSKYERTFPWMFRETLGHNPLRWYGALCFLRNRVCHPTRKPLTLEEFRFIEDVKEHFETVEETLSR